MADSTADFILEDDGPVRRPRATTGAGQRLRRIERLALLLDRSIVIGRWRIGLDPILGLVPGVGDWIGAMLSLYVLYEGARLGVRGPVLLRMAGNILVETLIGAIPVLGDIFDFAWKANTRNIALIHRHYRPGLKPRSVGWVWAAVGVVALVVLAIVVLLAYAVVKVVLAVLQGA